MKNNDLFTAQAQHQGAGGMTWAEGATWVDSFYMGICFPQNLCINLQDLLLLMIITTTESLDEHAAKLLTCSKVFVSTINILQNITILQKSSHIPTDGFI